MCARAQQDVRNFSGLERYHNWDLFNEIDNSISSVDLHCYADYQLRYPVHRDVFHDHGIFGSLLFLRLMHELFVREPDRIRSTENGDIVFDENLLHRALKKIARAIALHNVDSYENALDRSRISNDRLYILHGESLTWLLKISDGLQEWFKFPRNEKPPDDEPLAEPNFSINFRDGKIIVEHYPESKKEPLIENMKKYYAPENIVVFTKLENNGI